MTPFARGLIGAARVNATYRNTVASVVDNSTAFAYTIGGGVDVAVGPRLGVRVVHVDYNSISLPSRQLTDSTRVPFDLNELRHQNVRMSFGIVVR